MHSHLSILFTVRFYISTNLVANYASTAKLKKMFQKIYIESEENYASKGLINAMLLRFVT